MLGEQVEMFENDAELEKHFAVLVEMLQANDPDCTVSYQIDFSKEWYDEYDLLLAEQEDYED